MCVFLACANAVCVVFACCSMVCFRVVVLLWLNVFFLGLMCVWFVCDVLRDVIWFVRVMVYGSSSCLCAYLCLHVLKVFVCFDCGL